MKRLRRETLLSSVRTAAAVLVVFSLAVSVIIPRMAPPDTRLWQAESRIAGGGQWVSLPALNDRPERPGEKQSQRVQITLPVFVLEQGPDVFGTIVLPVRDDVRLTSHLVYTQTTTSRL